MGQLKCQLCYYVVAVALHKSYGNYEGGGVEAWQGWG